MTRGGLADSQFSCCVRFAVDPNDLQQRFHQHLCFGNRADRHIHRDVEARLGFDAAFPGYCASDRWARFISSRAGFVVNRPRFRKHESAVLAQAQED